jgi:DNA-binding transcriptional LysR family regulator
MINFSLRQLQYFVATVEHGGVSAAARACHVSQPSVSLAIAQLEAALGSTLFRRQASRGVALTAAGQRVLAQARDILGQAAALGAGDAPGELRGQLALICFQDLGPYFAPRLLAGFHASHPQGAVTMLEGDLATLQRALRSAARELALTELASTHRRRAARWRSWRRTLLPADHLLAAQNGIAGTAGQPAAGAGGIRTPAVPVVAVLAAAADAAHRATVQLRDAARAGGARLWRGAVVHRPAGDCS